MRRAAKAAPFMTFNFNPRTRAGCDFKKWNLSSANFISIHASVRDATISIYEGLLMANISIHASVRDATILQIYR